MTRPSGGCGLTGDFKHLNIIHFERDSLLAPIEPVSVPLSDIHTVELAPGLPAAAGLHNGLHPHRSLSPTTGASSCARRGVPVLPGSTVDETSANETSVREIHLQRVTSLCSARGLLLETTNNFLRCAKEPDRIRQRWQSKWIPSKPKRQSKWIVPQPKSPRSGDGVARGPCQNRLRPAEESEGKRIDFF